MGTDTPGKQHLVEREVFDEWESTPAVQASQRGYHGEIGVQRLVSFDDMQAWRMTP